MNLMPADTACHGIAPN